MVHDVLEYLRRESLDVYNRLHSIEEDARFVEQVSREVYPDVPLVPNLRCGAWYSDPAIVRYPDTPAYFKSTDGHFSNWSFNLRRANLHLVPLVAQNNGIILVDSTRSGKRIPDALSKTVPIWCAVINRAVARRYPSSTPGNWDTTLYTPPGAVSAQEHHQIEQRIDSWADALFNSSFDLPNLSHPLRPLWLTPATTAFPSLPATRTFFPVICLSASKQVHSGTERRSVGFSYVQGSGDDHELWSMGLTPDLFWAHRPALLASSRAELPVLIRRLVNTTTSDDGAGRRLPPSPIVKVGGRLLICTLSDLVHLNLEEEAEKDVDMAYVLLTPGDSSATTSEAAPFQKQGNATDIHQPSEEITPPATKRRVKNILYLTHHTPSLKKGQAEFLSHILPASYAAIGAHLASSERARVCVACETGKDASVGVVLAVLAGLFDATGAFIGVSSFCPPWPVSLNDHGNGNGGGDRDDVVDGELGAQIEQVVDKKSIRTRLEWIIASRSVANPARATLKRVNEFLITPGRFRR